ncbi:FtsJ-domain-containing protein [Microthyrium microscopicum]|uniref:Putative tRNA (cytidine(32)/guanosine(34)-2'-O)-methyltransferase n=1 Tax=Microthyrium microscopicum TaxID=703497 RepID=A0A6A6UDG5_9PEZI|nr:FtsJ-domain-containing protein [Microthyrium microscopicum]
MGKSSKDKRDIYYRLAKEQGWRARSAFKLIQIDEEFNLFAGVTRVVDLCAAPGSWSQVLSRVLIKGEWLSRELYQDPEYMPSLEKWGAHTDHQQERAKKLDEFWKTEKPSRLAQRKPGKDIKIVAIDMQPMSPLEGVTMLQADITHPTTVPRLLKALDPETYDPDSQAAQHPVDLVISDGAHDVTGLHDFDIYIQSQLVYAALKLALRVLRPGGTFVAKIFRAKDVDLVYGQIRCFFEHVHIAKPRASRATSLEGFIVARNFQPPVNLDTELEKSFGNHGIKPVDQPVDQEPRTENGGWRKMPTPIRRDPTAKELEEFPDVKEYWDCPPHPDDIAEGRYQAPYVRCGDLSTFDSDASYSLPEGYVSLDPVQPPTAPPYRDALEARKRAGGAYGKTKYIAKTSQIEPAASVDQSDITDTTGQTTLPLR